MLLLMNPFEMPVELQLGVKHLAAQVTALLHPLLLLLLLILLLFAIRVEAELVEQLLVHGLLGPPSFSGEVVLCPQMLLEGQLAVKQLFTA